MIHFVCEKETNKIVYITKQYKRACDKMSSLNVHVLSYNPYIFPTISFLKTGDILNEFEIESKRI